MYKRLSARTKALVSACLDNRSEDEDENQNENDDDIIEGSPHCSPEKKLITALPIADANHTNPIEIEEINATNIYENGEKSIEPPAYSPLTPRPSGMTLNAWVCKKQCMNLSPDRNISTASLGSDIQPQEVTIDKSVNFSPLSIGSIPITSFDPCSSPMQPMSPETKRLYNVLNDVLENDCGTPENIPNIDEHHPIDNSISPERTASIIFSSDDSVRDPDVIINDLEESDSSSGASESLLTTLGTVRNTPANTSELEAISSSSEPSQGRPKKGRKRAYGEYNRQERKSRKYKNLPYVNSKKKIVEPKKFVDFNCNCPKKCQENITVERRLIEFNKFYDLGTYESQNMFLAACVIEMPVKRSYVTNASVPKKKTFSREYRLQNVVVCQKMIINTLQTSSKRINTSLCKKRSSCITDKRGALGGYNRISSEAEEFVINVIKKLPTYISHYCRENCKDTKYLRPDMTLPKIYELYKDEAKSAGLDILSFSKVKNIFLTKFNLRSKPLKKDTCNKCDHYATKKKQGSEKENALIEDTHKNHLNKAKSLQNQLKSDMKLAQEDPFTETITFYLQKTLPLPRIPTNVIFYKRQLWVYNLGIHTGSNDQAHCNVWVEGEAGRGSQEVGSCLIKHVQERLGNNVKHLILWSDSCGGQNRNIKLTLMLKSLLGDHPTLESIRMRFLESGHSFLPNDTDFGRIECALKLQQRLYTPEDYTRIMKTCKKNKPMEVHRIRKEDFISSVNLEKRIINRKKAIDGSKVSWLNTKEILMKKEEAFSIFMRSNLDDEYIEINLKKSLRGNADPLTKGLMDPLWPNGKPIPEAKLNDIKSILHLIPEGDQGFYKNLAGDVNIIDDIDGFSGELDFVMEVEEENA